MHNVLGGTIDPHAAFLVTRGLKTLALRVRHVNDSALELAKRLEAHPKIARVHYPGGCRAFAGLAPAAAAMQCKVSAWLCMLLAAVDDAEVLHTMWRAGLPSHPDHEIAKAQMDGFGGVISFEVLQMPHDSSQPLMLAASDLIRRTSVFRMPAAPNAARQSASSCKTPNRIAGGRRHVAHGKAGGQCGAALHCTLPGRLRVPDRAAHHRVLLGPGEK
jgi:cystathionine beta-lyase/cystathionine gamma-synthase